MNYAKRSIGTDVFDEEKRQSQDSLFSIGNGYFGIRGFFEEDDISAVGNGGIYVAGIVGKGNGQKNFEGESRELCNIANVLRLRLTANGEQISGTDGISDFSRTLDMYNAAYTRKYAWKNTLEVELTRFADMAEVYRIGQRVVLRSKNISVKISLQALLDTDVKNLNALSCEPFPVQPGRCHIKDGKISENSIVTVLDDTDSTRLYAAQQVTAELNGKVIQGESIITAAAGGTGYDFTLKPGDELVLKKTAAVYTDKYTESPEKRIAEFLQEKIEFDLAYMEHCKAWEKRWKTADIEIDTDTDDETAVRYNLFELMCACPVHTDRISIGARGLTGEMYEGCVFWDNEIFQLPFFTYIDPDSARRLLAFRFHTLDAARRQAGYNWFGGAMFPWQVSEKGLEQTPVNGGGFYAIHITADIVYAIRQYINLTGDADFLWDMAAEILIETSRFWMQRSDYNEKDGHYHIRAVRGPNEYDVFVDDNAFTNVMAAEGMKFAAAAVFRMQKEQPEKWSALSKKVNYKSSEAGQWKKTAENIYVSYDSQKHLIGEDASYFIRRPLDIKKVKPTAKRIIDSTTNYEMLPLYQITKQSDTVTLMCLFCELFTGEEQMAAYEYYEPRTVHDSSLSYAPYAWLAARLGKTDEAYAYFTQCAYLDIADTKLNTISGIHFANFGGTWQAAVFGFGGVSFENGVLNIEPKLPDKWRGMSFSLCFKGVIIKVKITKGDVIVAADRANTGIKLCVNGEDRIL